MRNAVVLTSLLLAGLTGCPDRTISEVSPEQGRVEFKDIPVSKELGYNVTLPQFRPDGVSNSTVASAAVMAAGTVNRPVASVVVASTSVPPTMTRAGRPAVKSDPAPTGATSKVTTVGVSWHGRVTSQSCSWAGLPVVSAIPAEKMRSAN